MRSFDQTSASTYLVGDIPVARWEQYEMGGAMPFDAMWYALPPGSTSPPDCHPEPELSLVISGSAVVEAGGRTTRVEQGSAFLLDSQETHVVHNPSTQHPLLVFSAYWMPADPVKAALAGEESSRG